MMLTKSSKSPSSTASINFNKVLQRLLPPWNELILLGYKPSRDATKLGSSTPGTGATVS